MQRQLLENTLRELYGDFYDNDLPGMTRRRQVIPELPRCATVVLGMRRTGKTFLLFQRMLDLMGAGGPRDRMLYLNFEDARLTGMTPPDLRYVADVYYQMFPANRKRTCYFFFDEIQNVPGWESFARRMTDTPNVQVYMSGSSARLLSKEVATAMRGRSVEVEVLPLSFGEFLIHYGYFKTLPVGFGGSSKAKLRNGLEKYFQIGGMPAGTGIVPAWKFLLEGSPGEDFGDRLER
ncbi:MAG: AAA family ATPase [Victivallaceae bacterium]|nr:AAA family ATPase [Victivallaceae bacterium]